jgi:hypothetical protein
MLRPGVRNSVGMTPSPTGGFYFTDNGRDEWGAGNASVTDNTPGVWLVPLKRTPIFAWRLLSLAYARSLHAAVLMGAYFDPI